MTRGTCREGETAPGARGGDRVALIVLVLAVLWQMSPLYRPPWAGQAIVGTDSYRSHDWQEVAKLDLFARRSILEDGRFALWNPLVAGGTPQFAHPSDGSASPLFASSLLLGETLGMKVNVGLVALAGALGVYFLLRRRLGCGASASLFGAVAFAWSGWLPSRVAVGFYESCLMVAWPAVLALWLLPGTLAARRRRWVQAALLLWAIAIQLQLALPVLVLLMAVIEVAQVIQERRAGVPIQRSRALGGLAILALAGALGGIKFLPMLDLLSKADFREAAIYPTHPDAWYRDFDQLWFGLFHRVPSVPLLDADGGPRIQEYLTLRPGPAALALAAAGLLSTLRKGRAAPGLPFLVAGAVFLWLCFGPWAPVDGFAALRKLPLFASMRGPLRYFNFPVLLAICLMAGIGFDAVASGLAAHTAGLRRLHRRQAPLLAALLLAACLPAALDCRDLLRTSFMYRAEPLAAPSPWRSEGLRSISSGRSPVPNLRKYVNVRRGVPTVYTPEDIPVPVAAVPAVWLEADGTLAPEPNWKGEAWLPDREAGEVRVVAWRAQELVTAHSLVRPARVVLNQNHWEGWRCEGRPASRHQGLLAFEAPAGQDLQTTCRWSQPGLAAGAAVSACGLLGLLALWPRHGERPGRRGGSRGDAVG